MPHNLQTSHKTTTNDTFSESQSNLLSNGEILFPEIPQNVASAKSYKTWDALYSELSK